MLRNEKSILSGGSSADSTVHPNQVQNNGPLLYAKENKQRRLNTRPVDHEASLQQAIQNGRAACVSYARVVKKPAQVAPAKDQNPRSFPRFEIVDGSRVTFKDAKNNSTIVVDKNNNSLFYNTEKQRWWPVIPNSSSASPLPPVAEPTPTTSLNAGQRQDQPASSLVDSLQVIDPPSDETRKAPPPEPKNTFRLGAWLKERLFSRWRTLSTPEQALPYTIHNESPETTEKVKAILKKIKATPNGPILMRALRNRVLHSREKSLKIALVDDTNQASTATSDIPASTWKLPQRLLADNVLPSALLFEVAQCYCAITESTYDHGTKELTHNAPIRALLHKTHKPPFPPELKKKWQQFINHYKYPPIEGPAYRRIINSIKMELQRGWRKIRGKSPDPASSIVQIIQKKLQEAHYYGGVSQDHFETLLKASLQIAGAQETPILDISLPYFPDKYPWINALPPLPHTVANNIPLGYVSIAYEGELESLKRNDLSEDVIVRHSKDYSIEYRY